jgi:hypothetical protein
MLLSQARQFHGAELPACLASPLGVSPEAWSRRPVARLTLPCGLWMINSWKRVVSSLIIPWVVAI